MRSTNVEFVGGPWDGESRSVLHLLPIPVEAFSEYLQEKLTIGRYVHSGRLADRGKMFYETQPEDPS